MDVKKPPQTQKRGGRGEEGNVIPRSWRDTAHNLIIACIADKTSYPRREKKGKEGNVIPRCWRDNAHNLIIAYIADKTSYPRKRRGKGEGGGTDSQTYRQKTPTRQKIKIKTAQAKPKHFSQREGRECQTSATARPRRLMVFPARELRQSQSIAANVRLVPSINQGGQWTFQPESS